jgi:hypothetical protein
MSNDEASLALNLMHRSYGEVIGRLDFNQAAPPGFLVLQKLVIDAFGPSPYSLRLLPLLASLAACLLFYSIVASVASQWAALAALALFAISAPLVSYAATNKQYSIDVAVVLALYATTLWSWNRPGTERAILLASVGIIAAFVSHAAVFVLAAIWTALVLENFRTQKWRDVAILIGLAGVWLGSIATAFLLTRGSIDQIQQSAAVGWGPPDAALRTVGGIARYLLSVPAFTAPIRAGVTFVAFVLTLVGMRYVWKRSLRLLFLLVAPALFAGVAVWIGQYPNYPRSFLFVLPSILILIALGASSLARRPHPTFMRVGAAGAIVSLMVIGLWQTQDDLTSRGETQSTQVLTYLAEHARPGDSLYVGRTAQATFRYYLECGCFSNERVVARTRNTWPVRPTQGYGQFDAALESTPPSFIAGTVTDFSKPEYAKEFSPLIGRARVWILLLGQDSGKMSALRHLLDRRGRLLDEFPERDSQSNARLFLYALAQKDGPSREDAGRSNSTSRTDVPRRCE